ncbi:MAG: DUF805 domain-containing protein [Campylobacterota bacterium]|nr:DUF805 domain-containing protein [Campylobacterota bacterium]
MNPFNRYYIDTFKSRYMQFSGRASRSEFWYFALFNFITTIILSILDLTLGLSYTYEVVVNTLAMDGMEATESTITQSIGYLSTFYGIAVFLPSLSLAFRRLHDIGKSAWWLFIVLVPIVGLFILLYFYIKPSQLRNNRYGYIPDNIESRNATNYRPNRYKPLKIIGIVLIVLVISVGLLFYFMGSAVTGLSLAIVDSIDEISNQNPVDTKSAPDTLHVDQAKRVAVVPKDREQKRQPAIKTAPENKKEGRVEDKTLTNREIETLEDELKMLKKQREVLVQKLQEL